MTYVAGSSLPDPSEVVGMHSVLSSNAIRIIKIDDVRMVFMVMVDCWRALSIFLNENTLVFMCVCF